MASNLSVQQNKKMRTEEKSPPRSIDSSRKEESDKTELYHGKSQLGLSSVTSLSMPEAPEKSSEAKVILSIGPEEDQFARSTARTESESELAVSGSSSNSESQGLGTPARLFPMHSAYNWELTKDTVIKLASATERAPYLLTINEAGLLCDSSNQPFNSGITLHPRFVIDAEGNIYADSKKLQDSRKTLGKEFTHGSFLAGGPVRCAGNLTVRNGVIASINNESGHYEPDKESLVQTVKFLKSKGARVLGITNYYRNAKGESHNEKIVVE